MNKSETVKVRNLHTGQVGVIPRAFYEHPVINPGVLEEVEPDAKSYVPSMYRSRLTEPAVDVVDTDTEKTPKPQKTSKKENE